MKDETDNRSLMPRPDVSLEAATVGLKRIVSEMVESSLVLARGVTRTNVDLDAIVRDGKRLYCSIMKGSRFCGTEVTEQDIQAFAFRQDSGLKREEEQRTEDIQAFALFRCAAEAGHGEAQFIVSKCYHWGHGVQKDEALEIEWLVKSADSGFVKAQLDLGWRCETLGDVPRNCPSAVEWYLRAAAQGDAEAQYRLGSCYFYGEGGVFVNNADAVMWYRKAAEQGHANAQFSLAWHYEVGKGVPQDYPEAVRWYRCAAAQGNPSGQAGLGFCYRHGRGVPRDDTEAVTWYRMAAEQGSADAQNELGDCYFAGEGVTRDEKESLKWHTKAAENGHVMAQLGLGYCYAAGEGAPLDEAEAIKWFTEAAKRGNAEAQAWLANTD